MRKECVIDLSEKFKKFVPNSKEFVQLLPNPFPSFGRMYKDRKYDFYKENVKNFGDDIDLHQDFLILLVDTFNV